MNQYIVNYLGGDKPQSPEEGKAHFAKYQKWLESLGDSVLIPMAPYKHVHTMQSDGTTTPGSSVAMTGHTILQAESIEKAQALAKSCPFLEINGVLEVAEMIEM